MIMKMFKRLIALSLAAIMIAGLCACGSKNETGSTESSESSGSSESAKSDSGNDTSSADAESQAESSSGSDAVEAKLDGKLTIIKADDSDAPVIRGVSFEGNQAGSEEFNSKAASTEGIRCIFELNEWVSAHPDTDVNSDLKMYILKHTDDQKAYETAEFSDTMTGLAGIYNMELNEDNNWGEFYLNPDENDPGYYDFVFVYKDKAVAVMQTKFYAYGELGGKSDAELEKLMAE